MQIATDSWHYKFINTYTSAYRIPTNLCPYMRRLFWLMFTVACKGIVIAAVVTLAAIVAIAPVLALIHTYVIDFLPAGWLAMGESAFSFAVIVGSAVYLVLGCFAAFFALKETKDRVMVSNIVRNHQAKRSGKRRVKLPPKPPSVFVEWVKGIHNKTCSSLEFVDNSPKS